MASFVWEINLPKEYKGTESRFTSELFKKIDTFCEQIRKDLNSPKLDMNKVKRLLHKEKIVNILLVILGDASWYKDVYQSADSCVKEIEKTIPMLNNYKSELKMFDCEFRWLLIDAINWKGDEELCLNIFGN